jgi:hypothetical protein
MVGAEVLEAQMKLFHPTTVHTRWAEAYRNYRTGIWRYDDKQAIYDKIILAHSDVEKINAAIGNDCWTSFHCEECDKDKTLGVIFDNGDGGEVAICLDCLKYAVLLASTAEQIVLGTGTQSTPLVVPIS